MMIISHSTGVRLNRMPQREYAFPGSTGATTAGAFQRVARLNPKPLACRSVLKQITENFLLVAAPIEARWNARLMNPGPRLNGRGYDYVHEHGLEHMQARLGVKPLHLGALALALCLGLVGCGDRATTPKAAKEKTAATPNVSWPMTRGGPALSGNVAANVPREPVPAWTLAAAGPISAEGAIAGGRVYVGTGKGTLHCLSADSGQEIWKFESKDAITAAPAVSAGKVFVSSNDGKLYALNAEDGKEA